ncbi:MAG TPA: outer membrane lipoprotein chaperone LolA [Vicinamibacterales bacterium]|nr:outer membrane lipoprotein chaperone LolA [Vicinamibacterales bacterium]
MTRYLLLAAVLLLAWAGPATAQPAAGSSALDVATALQRRYDTVRDFSADFTQTYESGVLRRKRVERGTVLIKKPGRMRWNYQSPEEKLFVSDGTRMYFHDPGNNQVTINPVPEQDEAATAALFLTGAGDLLRDFAITFAEGGGPDEWRLRLEPRRRQPEYDWLELTVDRRTMQIRAIAAADHQGGRSTFQFSNVKENIGLADKTFAFTIPRGADVTYAGRAKQ